MITWSMASRDTAVAGVLLLALGWGRASESGMVAQALTSDRSNVRIPAESAGWDRVLDALLSAFETADVLALGEAHGRPVDTELRLRLVRHPEFSNKARLILAEHETQVDAEFSAAVSEVNRGLPSAKPLRVLITRTNPAALAVLREQVLGKGEKALVIYGSGHLWYREGGITSEIQRIAPGRVFVVESLAPPTPTVILENVGKMLRSQDRPVLVSLRGTAVADIAANQVFPTEAFFPGTTLGDLDDACVFFGGEAVTSASRPTPSSLRRELPAGASLVEMFDMKNSVTLKGMVSGVSVTAGEPHTYITVAALDQFGKPIINKSGVLDQWAIRGDSQDVLAKAGWTLPGMIKPGDVVEVLAYLQRPDVLLTALPIRAPWIRDVVKAGRLALGIRVTLADGRTLPYGQRP